MNEVLRKRYKQTEAFINKPSLVYKDQGKNRILRSGGDEFLIVGETETAYMCVNPHINIRCSIKKSSISNTYPRHDDYVLKDNYCYGVEWRKSNGFKIFNLSESLKNCI